MKWIQNAVVLGTLLVSLGCSNTPGKASVAKDRAVTLYIGAARHIEDLSKRGKLPGFATGEHGLIRSSRLAAGTEINYPARITLQVEKASGADEKIYWFDLEKSSPAAEWRVVRAWETDFRGENRRELSPAAE